MTDTSREWRVGFRKLLTKLDDLNNEVDLQNPIKGDIYFDGIEVESHISSLLDQAVREERGRIRNALIDIAINNDPLRGVVTSNQINDLLCQEETKEAEIPEHWIGDKLVKRTVNGVEINKKDIEKAVSTLNKGRTIKSSGSILYCGTCKEVHVFDGNQKNTCVPQTFENVKQMGGAKVYITNALKNKKKKE